MVIEVTTDRARELRTFYDVESSNADVARQVAFRSAMGRREQNYNELVHATRVVHVGKIQGDTIQFYESMK
jgi:hypothetical protein